MAYLRAQQWYADAHSKYIRLLVVSAAISRN